MDSYALGEAERKAILSRNLGDSLEKSVQKIKDDGSENELLVELALAVAVDGEISSSEKRLMNRVAALLDVSEADLELMLEAAIA